MEPIAWKVTASLEGVSAANMALNRALLSLMGEWYCPSGATEPNLRWGGGGGEERWSECRRRKPRLEMKAGGSHKHTQGSHTGFPILEPPTKDSRVGGRTSASPGDAEKGLSHGK